MQKLHDDPSIEDTNMCSGVCVCVCVCVCVFACVCDTCHEYVSL